ncbi:MAG: MGMT family protein [Candidatus Omnitrophica bacterium]|nr:MGMT family protein [Candidatus Omnitrophota bacterium]
MKKANVTQFQQRVYKVVKKIPKGEVRSYKWVAEQIGKPRAYRAVGQALNKNPYLEIIPCHRVICSSGSLGGYSLGTQKKRHLLDEERSLN